MKTFRVLVMASLLGGWIAVLACNSQPAASDVICQPSQLVRCNNCDKPPDDPRVYRGWITCSSDGTSFVGTCMDCEPDGTGDDGGEPPDTGTGHQDSSTGGDTGSSSGGDTGAQQDGGPPEPTTIDIDGTLDQPGNIESDPDPDAGTVTTTLSGTASSVSYIPVPTEVPDVAHAQSLTLSPDLGACLGSVSFSLTLDSATFSFEGVDTSPATDCADYATGIQNTGLQATFGTVPYEGGDAVATQVTLTLTAQ
jgi:hypothetical protein